MFDSKTILLFLYIVPTLTITASNEMKTSGTVEKSSTISNSTISNEERKPNEDVNANRTNLSYTEGGIIVYSQSTQLPTSGHKDETETDTVSTVVSTKKSQSKLTVKKVLDLPVLDRKRGDLTQSQPTTENNTTPKVNSDIEAAEKISKIDIGNHTSNISNGTSTVAVPTVNATKTHTSKTPKPKPTATIGTNKPIHSSPIESSSGRSRKIDYIIPVAITVVALPIVSAVAFILYTRGRDCWDKRHYRRMDFLIDGMYND